MSSRLRQRRAIGSVLFRSLLVLALWTGPIPWGHHHNLSGPDLAKHLAMFHDSQDCTNVGWHWHFTTPDGENPVSPEQDHEHHQPAAPDSARPDIRVAEAISSLQLMLAWAAITSDAGPVLDVGIRNPNSDHALSEPSSNRTAQQLLCRLTC